MHKLFRASKAEEKDLYSHIAICGNMSYSIPVYIEEMEEIIKENIELKIRKKNLKTSYQN